MTVTFIFTTWKRFWACLFSFNPIDYSRTGGRYREVRKATYFLFITRTTRFERRLFFTLKSFDTSIQQELSSSSARWGSSNFKPSAQYQFVSGFNETQFQVRISTCNVFHTPTNHPGWVLYNKSQLEERNRTPKWAEIWWLIETAGIGVFCSIRLSTSCWHRRLIPDIIIWTVAVGGVLLWQQSIVHVPCAVHTALEYISGSGFNTSASIAAVYDLSGQDHLDPQGDFGHWNIIIPMINKHARWYRKFSMASSYFKSPGATVPQSHGSALGATLR